MDGWMGGAAQTPCAIFQFTLDGRGEYQEKNKTWNLETGCGFMVIHPSDYRYYIPQGTHWSFFWLFVQHPTFVQRMLELRQTEEAVQTWPPGSPALNAAAELFEALCHRRVPDVWEFERLLFTWLWETERELYSRRYPERNQQWLKAIRQRVLQQLERPPGVPELATEHQMERTTFSRKFKAATGQSPAAFIMEVRLQEAMKQLRSDATLAQIADATGFADANHFSKAFRRHFGVTPGAHRNLILMRR